MQERVMNNIVISADKVPDQEVDDDSAPSHFGTSTGQVPDYYMAGAQEEG